MPGTAPLGRDEAADLLAPLRTAERVLIAVSGGPDSVALMHLAAWLNREGALPDPIVATVDHGLQDASHRIAAGVVDQAQALGIEAHLLRWEGPKPSTGIQNAARQARYGLLGGLAEQVGATHLVTAHTLDDQAETILFRMSRGSGPAGLVGMQACVTRGRVVHVRPLLSIAKQRLVATCRSHGWSFVEDPANLDHRFARARLRMLLPLLAAEGLDAEAFATLARRLARDQTALGARAASVLEAASRGQEADRKVLAASSLMAEPTAIALRALEAALTDFARAGPPRLSRLENVLSDLERAYATGRKFRRTLHGSLVSLVDGGLLEIRREGRRRRGTVPRMAERP